MIMRLIAKLLKIVDCRDFIKKTFAEPENSEIFNARLKILYYTPDHFKLMRKIKKEFKQESVTH